MLADDHRILREGIARNLREEGFDVVGQAQDGDEAIGMAEELNPDVILMDVTMPNVDGLEATRQIHLNQPHIRIVMLTMHADHDVFAKAIRNGAVGYLVKDCSTPELVEAVTMAAGTDILVSPQLAATMLDEVQNLGGGPATAGSGDEHDISPLEIEVMQLIVDGHSANDIGIKLGISAKAVKENLTSVYAKLQARDRTEAVMRAVRMGIVHLA